MSELPTVFLSYSWNNKAEADEIDNHFQSIGLNFKRDIRDVKYKNSIKEFMHQIGKSDYVVMLISDEFLNSENCMYEVTELTRDRDYKDRILQVILPSADIFNRKYRLDLIKKWNKRREELEEDLKQIPTESAGSMNNDLRYLRDISNHIASFLELLNDESCLSFKALKSNSFKELMY